MIWLEDYVTLVQRMILASILAVNVEATAGRRPPERNRRELVLLECLRSSEDCRVAFNRQSVLIQTLQRQLEIVNREPVAKLISRRVKKPRASNFQSGDSAGLAG